MGAPPPPTGGQARRQQLSGFLRARRAAITPAELGLPERGPRRTPGLRREEVADQAGVGLSWYTWLEQGRDITPSAQVLLALSRTLRLSPAERDHLFLLAGVARPGITGPDETEADDETRTLIQGLMPHPAYVLSPRFDVLAWNQSAQWLMSDLIAAPPERRNLLRWLFGGETVWSQDRPEWEAMARANLLDFRTEYGRHPGDPAYQDLVDHLLGRSELLRAWWAEHSVQSPEPAHKAIPHPELGLLRLLQSQVRLTHQPELRLRILVPADARTRHILADAAPA